MDRRLWSRSSGRQDTEAQTRQLSMRAIEAYHPCPAGKLLQTKKTKLVSQDRPIPVLWLRGCPRLLLYEPILRESGQPSTKHRAGPLNHVSRKKPILTRREPLKHISQRATPRIKLHIPLIKLIKKDQVCYSATPSTTTKMQPKGYIYKGYKVARKVLIGIQY